MRLPRPNWKKVKEAVINIGFGIFFAIAVAALVYVPIQQRNYHNYQAGQDQKQANTANGIKSADAELGNLGFYIIESNLASCQASQAAAAQSIATAQHLGLPVVATVPVCPTIPPSIASLGDSK